ncbi:GAF and ANTAR domain-containing protein [Actinomycetospora rhizophila]|uniref:GAF and ANTAR domain-containing protein n=1 Tax=Actinomycetospora rhizophila TaxID=1416876 RepID=A0ABV9ZBC8_9PSEU
MTSNDHLAVALRTAARDLLSQRSINDLQQTLAQIVRAAVDTVPGAEAGGISMTEGGEVLSRNPTTESITKLDTLQGELREGPCITAIEDPPRTGVVLADDLDGADADRWPQFAAAAVEAGYRSVLSTDIHTSARTRAALNLYAPEPSVFDAEAQLVAALFGNQAALLLYGSEQAVNLNHALDSRDGIGQAKGILMERFDVSDDEAFQMLVRSSQDTNIKLVDVARWLQNELRARRARRTEPPAPTT